MCESLLFYLSLIYRQVTLVVQVMTMTGRLKSALKTSRSAPQFVHSPKHQQKSAKTLAFVISWWCQCTGGVSVLVVSVHWWCQCTGGVNVLVVSVYRLSLLCDCIHVLLSVVHWPAHKANNPWKLKLADPGEQFTLKTNTFDSGPTLWLNML